MIVIKIELWPFGNKAKARELGRMHITNTGGSAYADRGDYDIHLMRKGTEKTIQRAGEVKDYPRKSASVWVLVKKALEAVNF